MGRLRQVATTEPYLIRIGAAATANQGKPYAWKDGLVCYNNRVVIPPQSPLINQLLREHHDTPQGGHSGVLRTRKKLARQFTGPSRNTSRTATPVKEKSPKPFKLPLILKQRPLLPYVTERFLKVLFVCWPESGPQLCLKRLPSHTTHIRLSAS